MSQVSLGKVLMQFKMGRHWDWQLSHSSISETTLDGRSADVFTIYPFSLLQLASKMVSQDMRDGKSRKKPYVH